MAADYEAVARELVRQHAAGANFQPFGAEFGVGDLDAAYAVQRAFVRRMCEESGAAAIGYKIGLTSKRMQAMCNIDQPIAGVVLAHRRHASGAVLPAASFGRVGLEFEIAVRLGRDLPARLAPFSRDTVAGAVEAVAPAVELVDDRHADYKKLEVASLVADNSWNGGIVLGEFRTSWPDLAAVVGVVRKGGAEVDRGMGRDVLGHPFEPLSWLANHLARGGEGLRTGEVVMTGSLVTTRFPAETEAYAFEVIGLGTVAVTITV
jgi:2-keto-4-pentenoate hydratase